jgi:hypothetical protein
MATFGVKGYRLNRPLLFDGNNFGYSRHHIYQLQVMGFILGESGSYGQTTYIFNGPCRRKECNN